MNAMILPAIMVLIGVFYVLFAAVRPPEWISHWFKIPAIFVFLPERLVRPIGSSLTGFLLIAIGMYLATLLA